MQKKILVTGASGGIGRAIATQLAADGFDILAHCGQNVEAGERTVAEIAGAGGTARLIQFDISDREQCRVSLEREITDHGAFYGAVLNAGITRDTAFPAMTDGEWDSVIHTNLDGFYNVLKPLTMPMVSARKGGADCCSVVGVRYHG